jgi:purine catabolism regulator
MIRSYETKFPVAELLSFSILAGHEVLAGESGLERPVRGVSVLDMPDPGGLVKENEVIIAGDYPFRNRPDLLLNTVKKLYDLGTAAFFLKTGSRFAVPDAVMAYCDEVSLPLVRLPVSAIFSSIVYEINESILAKKTALFAAIQDTTEALLDALQRRETVAARLFAIEQIIGNPVLIVRESFEFLVSPVTREKLNVRQKIDLRRLLESTESDSDSVDEDVRSDQDLWQAFYESDERTSIAFGMDDRPVRVGLIPVRLVGRGLIRIVVLEADEPIREEAFRALSRIGRIVALDFSNTVEIRRLQDRHEDRFIKSWLRGQYGSDIDICLAARNFGFLLSPEKTYWVLLADQSFSTDAGEKKELDVEVLHELGTDESDGKIYTTLGDKLAFILITDSPEAEPSAAVASLHRGLCQAFHLSDLSLCLSEPTDIVGVTRAAEQADDFYEIARLSGLKKKLIRRADLGTLPVLYPLRQTGFARDFVRTQLGPLFAFDSEHNSQLTYTLKTYLEQGYNVRETAEQLFTHYNTIAYRLDRIEEILGFSVKNSEAQFNLRLAFLLHLLSEQ